MTTVDPDGLDKVLEASGVSAKTRAKIKAANAEVPAGAPPAGHGCATPVAEPAKF